MATPLSIHNLMAGGWRTVLSISGISVAVVLIFMQLGFLGAVLNTAVVFYDNLKFDLVVRSSDYYHFCDANRFSRDDLNKIRSADGVDSVQPFHVSLGNWNYAKASVQRGMLIMGVDPDGTTFSQTDRQSKSPNVDLLTNDRGILVDQKSRPQFLGYTEKQGFAEKDIGLHIELNEKECEVVGLFEIGTGLAANGAALIHEDGFDRLFPNYNADHVTLGLVRLAPTGARDPEAARDRIYRQLGVDQSAGKSPFEILTRGEIIRGETMHWIGNTPVGFIFIAGVGVAFIVGSIIVYIVLSSDISKQIGEYATLKAMGYPNHYLARVVIEEALILGVISYIVAFVTSLALYSMVGQAANLPITMTVGRQVLVLVSTLAMCSISGVIAMQKLRKADPADLF